MRYLCIDYGSKKVGFANSDDEGEFAFPLMISPNDGSLVRDTLEIVKAMNIDKVIIGLSLNNDGKENKIAEKAKEFGLELKLKNINVDYEKEWYTTFEARKQPEAKQDVDDSAAALILQRYLDRVNPKKYEDEPDAEDSDEDGES